MATRHAVHTKSFRGKTERQKIRVPVVPLLAENARIGTYRVDRIADELLALGATPNDRIEFIGIIRRETYLAAELAVVAYRNRYVWEPRLFQNVKRLFDDIARIAMLIARNKNLDRMDLMVVTNLTKIGVLEWGKTSRDEIDELFAALGKTADAIKKFQDHRILKKRGGNHDPLTDWFMQNVYEHWCDHLRVDRNDEEDKLFVRFLSAAWQDVQFPTKDHDGRLLEDWLTDRVRKKFNGGVCDSRIEQQRQAL